MLQAEGQLHDQLRRLGRRFADRPRAVGALAPRRPIECEIGSDAGRVSFSGKAVGRLEGKVTEEDVNLEPLLDSLLLEEGSSKGLADRPDDVEEDVVDHGVPTLLPGRGSQTGAGRGWTW